VAEIAGGDAVAEFQGRDADQKIGEWKAHAFGLILTVDLPDAKSDHHRDRMNGQGRKQFLDELVPLFPGSPLPLPRKLEEARRQRQLRRQQAMPSLFARSRSAATMTAPGETEAGAAGTQPC
jgi:hypothetical protein